MCLHPEEIPPVPDETVRVASSAFPKGNLYMRLRFGTWGLLSG